jgi:hypothetical protein
MNNTTNTHKWEVFHNEKVPNVKVLVDCHLNFDVRYDVVGSIITHKEYMFHKQQICQSVSKYMNGKCDEWLCHPIDETNCLPPTLISKVITKGVVPDVGEPIQYWTGTFFVYFSPVNQT